MTIMFHLMMRIGGSFLELFIKLKTSLFMFLLMVQHSLRYMLSSISSSTF